MKQNPIIAVAQIKYFDRGNSNLHKIKKYISLAKKAKADIICFPETCIHKTEYLHLKHKFIKEICEECRKNSIWAIITEHIILKKKDYNMGILINRFGKVGIAICWDIRFPELFKKMKQKGAEIIFCSSKWEYDKWAHDKAHKKREIKILESLVKTRAYENLVYVALCNPLTKSKYQISYSAISSPHKILNEIVGKEGMIKSSVNLKELKKFKRLYGS